MLNEIYPFFNSLTFDTTSHQKLADVRGVVRVGSKNKTLPTSELISKNGKPVSRGNLQIKRETIIKLKTITKKNLELFFKLFL